MPGNDVVTPLGLSVALLMAAYFAFAVPTDLAVLPVSSAAAVAAASFGPALAVVFVARLVE